MCYLVLHQVNLLLTCICGYYRERIHKLKKNNRLNNMNNSIKRTFARTLTTRLPDYQFEHVKAQVNPSAYIRSLIEKDMVNCGVKHEQH